MVTWSINRNWWQCCWTRYFSSVFTTEDQTNIPSLECQVELMADITIGAAEVQKKLQDLRTDKAPGADLIHPRLLKELAVQVAYPLAIILQQSIDQSRVPQQWRTANVIPIFKKGSKRDAANYRPISLTSHVGKLLERIIRDHILRHLDNKQLIKPSQHGFLPGRSCQSNLLEFLERVTDDTDRGNNTDVAYLDFAKAFDKVPHARLLVWLKALGLNNRVSSWIEAWLRDRRQRVFVGGEESAWSAVSSGVPQGSILGPLLFIVYINDLDEKMTSTVLKFADDTKISSNSQQELQRDLDTAVEWAQTWQMQFNTNKCKVMHVGHRNERAIYNMGNHRLEEVEEEKDLGVLIHRTLSVSNNCAVAVKKANQMAGHIDLQNCDTQERTNCCTTVQSTSETTSGVLLTSLVTLSQEGHSKHWKSSTKSDQNDSLDLCPNLRRMPEANGTDITGEPPTQGWSARKFSRSWKSSWKSTQLPTSAWATDDQEDTRWNWRSQGQVGHKTTLLL